MPRIKPEQPPTPMRSGSYKFDREMRDRFLKKYSETGRKYEATLAAGVCEDTVNRYIKNNFEGFGDEFQVARGLYCDKLEREIERRAVEGVTVPIIGGKDRDQIVCHVQEYSDRLLEFHAKRHIPEYRDRQQIDMNVTGGVMVVEAVAKSEEDWVEAFAEETTPALLEEELKKN